MALRASKPSFNVREKLTELGRRFGLKGSELVAAETVQEARDLVSAGRKNLVINGSMMINQRGNATGVNVSGNYGIDRFYSEMGNSISGNWSVGQSTDVPVGSGVENSLEYSCTTTSSNADRYLMTLYRMEGYDSQVFNYGTAKAKTITLSFWIKCSKAGDFQVNFENEDNPDQGYQTKQTIHKSGTWEKKVVTIPGDKTKEFPSTSAKAMCFDIMYSAFGSQRTGTTPTAEWSALSNTQRGTHCNMDLFDSTSNYVKITGVQLELGKNATEFEHRSYGEELALCQRYYWKAENFLWLYSLDVNHNYVRCNIFYPVEMRVPPTITGSFNYTGSGSGYQSQTKIFAIPFVNAPGTNLVNLNAGAEFSAEL